MTQPSNRRIVTEDRLHTVVNDVLLDPESDSRQALNSDLLDPEGELQTSLKSTYQAKGTTAQRPTSPPVGMSYFDTTLGRPIWRKDATSWVDATGTPV